MTTLPLYARAALPLIPGASRLPFVAGGGGEIPEIERSHEGVRIEPDHLAAYSRVCEFRLVDAIPATYPHILAFPLHMQLMTDGRFPFPPIGLVHIANEITVHRAVRPSDALDLRVHPTPIENHPKGRTFSIVTEASIAGERVWEETSTILRRGRGGAQTDVEGGAVPAKGEAPPEPSVPANGEDTPPESSDPATAEWTLAGDLGRRYASVSGDRNPIHLHDLTARLFGFPSAIAHGMWTKARCLAALEPQLPDAYSVEVDFGKPIRLPAKVAFAQTGDAGATRFSVRDVTSPDLVHLEGVVTQ